MPPGATARSPRRAPPPGAIRNTARRPPPPYYAHNARMLAEASMKTKCPEGKVSLISINGLHQLHIFIFFLAVFHVSYSAITMALGRAKVNFDFFVCIGMKKLIRMIYLSHI